MGLCTLECVLIVCHWVCFVGVHVMKTLRVIFNQCRIIVHRTCGERTRTYYPGIFSPTHPLPLSLRECVCICMSFAPLFSFPHLHTRKQKTAAFFNWIANSFIVMSCEVGFFICSWAARFFLQGLFAKVLSYTHTHTLRDTHRHTQTHTHTRYIHTHHTQQ